LRPHDAPFFVSRQEATCWSTQIRESIKAAREESINMMYVAKSQSQTTAAATTFIKQIECWIMELRGQNLHQNLLLLETQIQKNIRTHDKTASCQPNVQRRQGALERNLAGKSVSSPCSPIGAMHPEAQNNTLLYFNE
jgi:hypothetical protein